MEQLRAKENRLQYWAWIFRITGVAHPEGAQLVQLRLLRAPGSLWHVSLLTSHLQTFCSQAGLFSWCIWGSLSVYAIFLFFFFSFFPPLTFNVPWQEAQKIPCCPPADAASHVRACKGALDGKGATWAGDPTPLNRIPSLRSVRITGEALFSTELWYLSGQQEQAQC